MFDDIYTECELTKTLDERLKIAKENKGGLPPVAIVSGLTGTGKTAIIKSWLKHNKLNYCHIDMAYRLIDDVEVEYVDYDKILKGKKIATFTKLEFTKKTLPVILNEYELNKLDEDNLVVFIDDYDWAYHAARKEILKLVNNLTAVDPREPNNKFTKVAKDILMFIITVHPDEYTGGAEPYDDEEKKIFGEKKKKKV